MKVRRAEVTKCYSRYCRDEMKRDDAQFDSGTGRG